MYRFLYIHICVCCRCYLHRNLHLMLQSLLNQNRDKQNGSIWKNFLLGNIPNKSNSAHQDNHQIGANITSVNNNMSKEVENSYKGGSGKWWLKDDTVQEMARNSKSKSCFEVQWPVWTHAETQSFHAGLPRDWSPQHWGSEEWDRF